MPYLSGSYLCGLSGDTRPTDENALEAALAQASSDKQLANYKRYYRQIMYMTPEARAQLMANLNRLLARLPTKTQNLVMTMANRTASYMDPRGVPGLGNPAAAAAGAAGTAASTASTIATITGIVATLGTIGLQVATTIDQRQQQKDVAKSQQASEKLQQQILQSQLEEQQLRIADLKAQQAAKQATTGPTIGPNGEVILPSTKPSTGTLLTGAALTAGAAYMLLS